MRNLEKNMIKEIENTMDGKIRQIQKKFNGDLEVIRKDHIEIQQLERSQQVEIIIKNK